MTYEIINHGISAPDYFSGCGTYGTSFDSCVTGCGTTEAEAFDDACDQLYETLDGNVDEAELEEAVLSFRDYPDPIILTDHNDLYYYVSIRFNAH